MYSRSSLQTLLWWEHLHKGFAKVEQSGENFWIVCFFIIKNDLPVGLAMLVPLRRPSDEEAVLQVAQQVHCSTETHRDAACKLLV